MMRTENGTRKRQFIFKRIPEESLVYVIGYRPVMGLLLDGNYLNSYVTM
jgi:hypothetical protein